MEVTSFRHKKYKRFGLECFKDPVRNILIQATPEEAVRQDVVSSLVSTYGYDLSTLSTEYMIPETRLRADVVVWIPTNEYDDEGNRLEKPFIVVECKSHDVYLTQEHFEQGATYCEKLGATYLVVTNGVDVWVYERRNEDEYQTIKNIPTYGQVKAKKWFPKVVEVLDDVLPRPTYEMLTNSRWLNKTYRDTYGGWLIGDDVSKDLWAIIIDLQHFLWKPEPFFRSAVRWKGYVFLEDLGVSSHSFGNAGGGDFPGEYRSFLVRDRSENNHIVRFLISGTEKMSDGENRNGITCVNVAVCNGESMHNSLQLNMNTCVNRTGDVYHFTHAGQMTVGNLGRVKNQLVVDYVRENESSLIDGKEIHLGSIVYKDLLKWSDLKKVLLNMTVYGLLRDDLRTEVRNQRKL